ncbi:MAG: RNHCP domain-containing protein [Planctomycetota bacterium]
MTPEGGWVIIHRCTGCDPLKANRIADDDAQRAMLGSALGTLAQPAFPLDDAR